MPLVRPMQTHNRRWTTRPLRCDSALLIVCRSEGGTLPAFRPDGDSGARAGERRADGASRAFGDEIRAQRKAQGLSQEQLADLAGMHRAYIGSVERGERNLSLDSIYALAGALRIHVSELFPRR